MKKNDDFHFKQRRWSKVVLKMKLIVLFCLLVCTQLSAKVFSQSQRLSIQMNELSLVQVFDEIERLTDVTFLYRVDEVSHIKNVSIEATDETLMNVLEKTLENTNLQFKIVDDTVVVSRIPEKQSPEKSIQQNVKIKGKVTDVKGEPLPFVTVVLKGSQIGVSTDLSGNFIIDIGAKIDATLVFSSIGMQAKEVKCAGRKIINVVLQEDVSAIGEVVVTGLFNRKKESFTGNVKIVSGEELINMGTQNLIKSLSVLDPSLQIVENNELGSNPNALPEIRLRGQSQIQTPDYTLNQSDLRSDPNLPTFIMDGYEISLTEVVDLDMNRVESVTVLKDAASTAIYGSRAANGVIVIKTKQPKAGEVKVSYNLTSTLNVADLSSYNLLNSEELFDLQKQLGLMKKDGGVLERYNQVAKWLAEGVDTDWLSQPVRNSIGQKHSLNLMGGDKHMRYGLDLNYSNNPGVMKGSSRNNYGIKVNLNYNLNEKLLFSNSLSVTKNKSKESPYGSFGIYTVMPGYFPLYNNNGQLMERYDYKFSDVERKLYQSPYNHNPVHEAGVGNINETSYITVSDNFSLDWSIRKGMKLSTRLSYSITEKDKKKFTSPDSYIYDNWQGAEDDKGEYSNNEYKTEKYEGNVMFTYSKGFYGHFINMALGVNFSENKMISQGYKAVGFGDSETNNPAFAKKYPEGSIPSYSESTSRLVGALSSLNYSYKNRYLLDLSCRLDGSSQFGSENKAAPFFSTGLGWNLHNEEFLEKFSFISILKLRATYGETGSVSFSPYQSKNMYEYYSDERYMGTLGVTMKALGNSNLKWQTTKDQNLGIDLGLFNGKLNISANKYKKTTVDMVMDITTPPSIGFDSYVENLGEIENSGYDFSIAYNLNISKDFRMGFNLSGAHNEDKIKSIGSALEGYNEYSDNGGVEKIDASVVSGLEQENTDRAIAEASHKFFVRFEEGKSQSAIYAVRSLGVDPVTGEELFLKKDGVTTTYDWDAKDKVVVGNMNPDLMGSFGLNASYKNLYVGINFSYEFGGQAYNSTLVNKVESSNKKGNVDRRVYDAAWLTRGDDAQFKTTRTYASTRFVQDNNYLKLSSITAQYTLPTGFAKKLGMESIRCSLNTSEIAYWGSIKRERGIDYPFARTMTLGLRANF